MSKFYNKNYQEYFDSIVNVNPESFLRVFADTIPGHSEILDIGCGSGRDLLWLSERGHKPIGLERSEKLAELAEKHSGCPVIVADLETYDFCGHQVDGIILVGSLVHIYYTNMKDILERLIKALKPGGYLFLSLKENTEKQFHHEETKEKTLSVISRHYNFPTSWHFRNGRIVYLWQDHELKNIFKTLNLEIVDFSKNKSMIRKLEWPVSTKNNQSSGDSSKLYNVRKKSTVWLGYVLKLKEP